MKKYVKQIIVAVIVATIVSCSLYYYDSRSAAPKKPETVTDAEGHSYLVVDENKNGTQVAVTDANGNVYAAEFDGKNVGEAVTDKQGNTVSVDTVTPSDLPSDTTAPAYSIDDTNDNFYTGAVSEISDAQTTEQAQTTTAPQSTTAPEDTTVTQEQTTATNADTTKPAEDTTKPAEDTTKPAEDTTKPTEDTTKPSSQQTQLLAEKYKKVFEGGTYKMEFTTNDEDLSESPVLAAFKNGNILMRTTLMGIDLTIIYYPSKNDGYIVIHKYKKYCKLPEALLEEMKDTATTGAINDGEYVSVDVSTVQIDGENLIREEYIMDDGATIKYYFKDSSLVRRDRIEPDGVETDMYITMLTSDVPDSDFEIPDNYSNINISWLSFLLEQ